jgi:erythromycin esterase
MVGNWLSRESPRPLRTLDPAEPLDDLEWLDEAVGAARVVAIGESAHYNRESFLLRHRLLRCLVERHGFHAYAHESGFVDGWRADDWVRGGDGALDPVLAGGLTSLMGLWTQMRAQLQWLREHNRTAVDPVGFYGIDLPGSNASLLPGVDTVLAYLRRADPEFEPDPAVRETAATFGAPSAFAAPATIATYAGLAPEVRNALTAGLAELAGRMTGRRLGYVRRTSTEEYDRARHCLGLTITLDGVARAMVRGDQPTVVANRDAAIAGTVQWILRRHDRVVLATHNGHLQRVPGTMPGLPPFPTMGMHLADRLGDGYLAIGTTTGSGRTLNTGTGFFAGTLFTDLTAPEPGSLDAMMAAGGDRPFALDLRRLSSAGAEVMRRASRQRFGSYYSELDPMEAYDVLVHLPHLAEAEPDFGAVAASPIEVREAFSAAGRP